MLLKRIVLEHVMEHDGEMQKNTTISWSYVPKWYFQNENLILLPLFDIRWTSGSFRLKIFCELKDTLVI